MSGFSRVLAAALTGAVLAIPPTALAQGLGNPLSPGIPQQPLTAPTASTPTVITATPTASSGSGGLSGGNAIAIAIGAIVILGGISFFIWHDARRRAPVRHRAAAAAAGAGGRSASKQRARPRKLSPAERRRRKRGRAR